MIHPVPKTTHTSIGSGITQSESLLSELDSLYLPVHQTLLYAVRAMLRVKQLAQGCGGKTEAVLLMKDDFIMKPATIKIDSIEYLIEEMDQFLLDRCAGFIAGRVNMDEQSDLNEQVDLLKRFKAKYKSIVPDLFSWYEKGEIRF